MSKQSNLTIKMGDSDKPVSISATFSEEEIAQLIRYDQFASELTEGQVLKEGGPARLNVKYDPEEGLQFNTDLPPDDQISALLHRLRPFILEQEDTYFYKICNILGKNFENEQFRSFLKAIRYHFSAEKISTMCQVTVNNTPINSDEMVNMWLNAYEYHRDDEKREKIKSLSKVFPFEATRALLMMIVYDKADAILTVGKIIQTVRGKQSSFSVRIS